MSEPTVLHRVYVWERPVRFYHWINALCVAVLCATGFMIGRPIMKPVTHSTVTQSALSQW